MLVDEVVITRLLHNIYCCVDKSIRFESEWINIISEEVSKLQFKSIHKEVYLRGAAKLRILG